MDKLIVSGGNELSGEITPSGNKNSVLPIICATLLTQKPVTLKNVPNLTDVQKLINTLKNLGSNIIWEKNKQKIIIDNSSVNLKNFNNELPLGMRGSILLFAPLLSRAKKLKIKNEIGGCALGIREIDTHLEVLKSLGAKVENGPILSLEIPNGFQSTSIWREYTSVTTTENFIMGAVRAKGVSVINNAASEPHVQDLCNFLNQIGAKIKGVGTSRLEITGVEKLNGTTFTITTDHHEAVTMLALGIMTGGKVTVKDVSKRDFPCFQESFNKLGVEISTKANTTTVKPNQAIKVKKPYTPNLLQKIEGAPWPYFPVDLLPLMVALATKAEGEIMFWNKVYEGGFFWIQEMIKFGAQIHMSDPHRVIVFGNKPLRPAVVDAPDIIRPTVALAMMALSIDGESIIRNADPIKRAHPNFVEKLNALGANIKWEKG
jgi:UDP-N-acetylglucosamine 1-carboxyvinyltransferase